MRTLISASVGLIVGVVAGLLMSEVIGIAGYLVFDRAVGVKFLPVILGGVFAFVAVVLDLTRRAGRSSR